MKIHHTNRTMNATFNLKRFLLLEQYKRNETGRHLLWSAAVVSFICILCILYDINRGGSYYGSHSKIFYLLNISELSTLKNVTANDLETSYILFLSQLCNIQRTL
mgnify:CR=1 FL=1